MYKRLKPKPSNNTNSLWLSWPLILSSAMAYASDPAVADLSTIPLVGKDSTGQSKVVYMPSEQYVQKMKATLSELNNAVIPALNRRTCNLPKKSHYELTSVTVGVSIEFQVGLGALISLAASSKMQLAYSNQWDPVLPE